MMIFPFPAGNSRRRRRLKNPGAPAPGFLGVWGRQPPTSRAPGIYRRIACRCLSYTLSHLVQFQLQSRQQVHWDAYRVHWRFSIRFQNLPVCPRSQSSSDECGQFPQIRSKHLGKRLSCCEDCVLFSQLHYCRIAPPHPAFSTDSV